MALTLHRDEDDDAYAGADTSGVELVSGGSVTSFVRKLFQMVQGECNSIVGFVADGTAFEVKDPRRLEQDILPKYFRHSRFQSLVRQLNFYSFKKISKERSVWIYKHAFFRRDEPELLHALKRKTNQHGSAGPIGRMVVGGEDVMERSPVDRSFSRVPNDNANDAPRSRGPSFLPRHGGPSSGFQHTHHYHDHHHSNSPSFSHHQHHQNGGGSSSSRNHPRTPQHPLSAPRRPYHASSSRSTGGGPSTGGGAVPSYGGQGPSSRGGGGGPGFRWAGAGGRPVGQGGGPAAAEYDRGVDRNGGGGVAHPGGHNRHRSSSSQEYRQGPATGENTAGNRGPATSGAVVSADKDQALAIWGLSALCQAASSASEAPTAATGASGDAGPGASTGGGSSAGARRLFDSDGSGDRQQPKRHRGEGSAAAATARGRRAWGAHDESSLDAEEDEEDGVTSAERDDSSMSVHRRSPSNSSCASSSSSLVSSADSAHSSGNLQSQQRRHPHNTEAVRGDDDDDDRVPTGNSARLISQRQQRQRGSGSGGVFCPTWDWGRAACEPAIRLPGSFVDRRYEEVDQQVKSGLEMEDDEAEESSKTEEEDVGEDEGATDEARTGAPDAMKKEETSTAEISPSTATAPQPRDLEADMEAEVKVGLEGIGELFNHLCSAEEGGGRGSKFDTKASESVFLATVTDSGDSGLREMAVFCAGPAGKAPDEASPTFLARQVSVFLESEVAVAQDLRVYAEALDPAAVDVVISRTGSQPKERDGSQAEEPLSTDAAKLLRIFCRYAACRLGRALEVASCAAAAAAAAEGTGSDGVDGEKAAGQVLSRQGAVAQRVTPRLYECRWKWWRAAVRFS